MEKKICLRLKTVCLVTVLCFSAISCATSYPGVVMVAEGDTGNPREWIKRNISTSDDTGVLYSQLVLFMRDPRNPSDVQAAVITVGKINNQFIAQMLIPRPYMRAYTTSGTIIELENIRFDVLDDGDRLERQWFDYRNSAGVYLRRPFFGDRGGSVGLKIADPETFIKLLQEQKAYNSRLLFNMEFYGGVINGNLELF